MKGYIKVGTAVPEVRVGDCGFNSERIVEKVAEASSLGVQYLCFPELCITGYTCADLFMQQSLLENAIKGLEYIREKTKHYFTGFVVGMPLEVCGDLYNVAVVIHRGEVKGIVPKTYIPNYGEFYEKRWFTSGADCKVKEVEIVTSRYEKKVPFGNDLIFNFEKEVRLGVEVCEDVWTPIPPSTMLALGGANVIMNLSASNETVGKHEYRRDLIKGQSSKAMCVYVYASAGAGESTTDLVFSGDMIVAQNGSIIYADDEIARVSGLQEVCVDLDKIKHDRLQNKSFADSKKLLSQELRVVECDKIEWKGPFTGKLKRKPFVVTGDAAESRCREIFKIQVAGLRRRLEAIGSKKAVIGVSGGLDSTLALLVTVEAFDNLGWDRKGILGITMPGYGTTDRTYSNACKLMEDLEIDTKEVSIVKACDQHFEDIGHDKEVHDIAYENVQARERTQILMDSANERGGIVIGTGDLSELALGWCTYNGDHMSMYAVNTSIPKTLVRQMVAYYGVHVTKQDSVKFTIRDILETPISPELLPTGKEGELVQKTEDSVGPYELNDFFLYYVMRFGFSPTKVYELAKVAFGKKEKESDKVYDETEIKKWLEKFYRRFFTQQFKRSCIPDGPKVGTVSLSPRGDWRMPSDAVVNQWIEELREIK